MSSGFRSEEPGPLADSWKGKALVSQNCMFYFCDSEAKEVHCLQLATVVVAERVILVQSPQQDLLDFAVLVEIQVVRCLGTPG